MTSSPNPLANQVEEVLTAAGASSAHLTHVFLSADVLAEQAASSMLSEAEESA